VSLWARLRDAFSNAPRNDFNDLTGLSPAAFAAMFQFPTSSGVTVTPESAMKAIPVQACTSLIAGGVTSMPLAFYRREFVDGTAVLDHADDHEYWWLFNEQPNEELTAAAMWDQVLPRLMLYGEAFVRIVRAAGGRSGKIVELVPVDNRAVQIVRVWDKARRRRRITQYVVNDAAEFYGVDPSDMLHFSGRRAMCEATRSAILDSCREAVGIVLAVEQYCGRIFSNGGTPRLALEYPAGTKITDAQKEEIRANWPKYYGGAENQHLPFIVGAGGKINKISFSASEAQMLEARKFQVIDIARAFGVPPFMIGESEKQSSWGSGIEQLSQGFIRYTLSPHITAIEQEINRKIFTQQTYLVDFDEESLARGDMKALGEWFRQAIGGSQGPGFLMPNEVRRRLKMKPVPGGDELYEPKASTDSNDPQPPGKSAADPAAPEVDEDA
jgi:HK97 family phage portal protein